MNTCSAGENCERCCEAYEFWYANKPPVGEDLEQLKNEAREQAEKWRAENPEEAEAIDGIFGVET